MIEILHPSSREEWLDLRKPTIGGTESPMMLGVHPRVTPFELWAKKSDLVPPMPDNKRLRRGRILQPIAVDLIREERPEWVVTENPMPGGEFYRDIDAGISCTPDAFVFDSARGLFPDSGIQGICQIKTVDAHIFRNEWMIDGDIVVPPYVAIQTMQEAHLTGAAWCCVAAIVGFDLDMHIIEVKIHAGVIARIKREVQDFMRRIRENDPPPPDYGRDGEAIAALYDEDDGGTVDLSGNDRVRNLVASREEWKDLERTAAEAAKARKVIDAELIHLLGNATRGVLDDGRVIEAKTVRRKGFAVESTSYRSIKIKQQRNAAA